MGRIMYDCFAYDEGECRALIKLYCRNVECKFYQSRAEYNESCIKSLKRRIDKGMIKNPNKM
jgi:hypothetical protein